MRRSNRTERRGHHHRAGHHEAGHRGGIASGGALSDRQIVSDRLTGRQHDPSDARRSLGLAMRGTAWTHGADHVGMVIGVVLWRSMMAIGQGAQYAVQQTISTMVPTCSSGLPVPLPRPAYAAARRRADAERGDAEAVATMACSRGADAPGHAATGSTVRQN